MNRAARLTVLLVLVAGCSSGTPKRATPAVTPVESVAPSATPTATATPTPTPTPTPTRPPVPIGPAGTKVPAGFEPSSATFISAKTGWVLGKSPCPSGTGDCDVIARTRDGGLTWKAIPSPKTTPERLGQIRFANATDGFVTGNDLWASHDGGATWKVVPGHPDVSTLEAAAGRVWIKQEKGLASAPVTGGPFTTELGFSSHVSTFTLHGTTAVVTTNAPGDVLVGPHGGPFTARAVPCTSDEGPVVGLATDTSWLLLCVGGAGLGMEQKTAYTSSDAGATWLKRNPPPQTTGDELGLTTDGYFVFDHQQVSVTRDGGKTWTVSLGGGGIFTGGFESATLGFVIGGFAASSDSQSMQITRDAGRSWKDVTF